MRKPVVIALSAVIAVVSSFSLWTMVNSKQGVAIQTDPIVMLKNAVPLHAKLTEQDVTVVQVPVSVAPQAGVHNAVEAVGKFTTHNLENGEYLFVLWYH